MPCHFASASALSSSDKTSARATDWKVSHYEMSFSTDTNELRRLECFIWKHPQIARSMGPTWGPPGSCRPQMGPLLVPWTLLSVSLIAWSCFAGNLFEGSLPVGHLYVKGLYYHNHKASCWHLFLEKIISQWFTERNKIPCCSHWH